jgi:hypothetical protein
MRRFFLFLSVLILCSAAVPAAHAAGGCCQDPDSTLPLFRKIGEADIPLTQTECAEKNGKWVFNAYPDLASQQCIESAPISVLNYDTPTVQKSKGITFIPNIEIPGLFSGEIVIGSESIGQYIAAFYIFFVALTGVLAVAMMVLAGFRWITAAGNASKITEAKDMINGALFGLMLVLLSYLLLNLINPTLTKLAGLQLSPIKPILFQFESEFSSIKGEPAGNIVLDPNLKSVDPASVRNVSTYDALLVQAAQKNRVDVTLLKAIMIVESGGKARAISSVGACGLMQVMPGNVGNKCLIPPDGTEPGDPAYDQAVAANIDAGAKLLSDFWSAPCPEKVTNSSGVSRTCDAKKTQCKPWDPRYAVAAYNGGTAANCDSAETTCQGLTFWECKENWDTSRPNSYLQTVNYVVKVLGTYNVIKQHPDWIPK